MAKLIPAVIATLLLMVMLTGCVAQQSRDNPDRDVFTGVDVEPYTYRHGEAGQEIAELFNTGDVYAAQQDYSGSSHGLRPNAFYTVSIAEDPLRPTVLTTVGYIRKLEEDRGDLFMYEFFDGAWLQIAYMGENGSLYRYDNGREELLGRFELDAAVRQLFQAENGYGYDSVLQDRAIVDAKNPDVNSAAPRGRGVYHRTHKSSPAVVVYTLKRSGEAGLLADRYTKERAEQRYAEEAQRLKQERTGGFGEDEDYGGLRYKDGNPVDENDRPLKPESTK